MRFNQAKIDARFTGDLSVIKRNCCNETIKNKIINSFIQKLTSTILTFTLLNKN